jgi:hypothetical protein
MFIINTRSTRSTEEQELRVLRTRVVSRATSWYNFVVYDPKKARPPSIDISMYVRSNEF